ncbi:Hypothetical protein A7982_01954 [Minicystis rosea]|nr:Hypothetical protein A7982_01954 [Minicystis rosea]
MVRKHLAAAGRRPSSRSRLAPCAFAALVAAILSPAAAAAATPMPPASLYNEGRRWLGITSKCVMPGGSPWIAEPLFDPPPLPVLSSFCLYSWPTGPKSPPPPTAGDIKDLFSLSGAAELTEDVPVVFPQASSPTDLFAEGLRKAFRLQVGDASLLPSAPAAPAVRVVVIDSTPDAAHGQIPEGESRHGDTLAHLIEDVVCDSGQCVAEVTTTLALPWLDRGVPGLHGGHIGTLSDVARAVARALSRWQHDMATAPFSTPPHLVLNMSIGWEHTPGIADCYVSELSTMGPPARAVLGILQYAASQGALIVAAAGNDTGGPTPPPGLLCPGRYQALAQIADPQRPLLVAASGVDYQDAPLETTRPYGVTALVGLGLGGVAWGPGDSLPAPLTGSSVSAAVVSAVSAVVWAHEPSYAPEDIIEAVYDGGTDLGQMDLIPDCPTSLGPSCYAHRVSVCGALVAAGAPVSCSPPAQTGSSSPNLDDSVTELVNKSLSVTANTVGVASLATNTFPRYLSPTVQSAPSVFPQPIVIPCPSCVIVTAPGSTTSNPALYFIGTPDQTLLNAMLVMVPLDGGRQVAQLGTLVAGTAFRFLMGTSAARAAYLTGFDNSGFSVTQQIVVQP